MDRRQGGISILFEKDSMKSYVLSPLTEFLSQYNEIIQNDDGTQSLAFGVMGSVENIPEKYIQRSILIYQEGKSFYNKSLNFEIFFRGTWYAKSYRILGACSSKIS